MNEAVFCPLCCESDCAFGKQPTLSLKPQDRQSQSHKAIEKASIGLFLILLTACPFPFMSRLCVCACTMFKRASEREQRANTIYLTVLEKVTLIHMTGWNLPIIYYFTFAFRTIACCQTSLTNPEQILSYLYNQVHQGPSRTNIKYIGNTELRGFDDFQVGKS